MTIHRKRKPPRHVPGTRKPAASWPIQPKEIAALIAQQKQRPARLTDEHILWQKEELVRQLRKWLDGLKGGSAVVEEQIRIQEAEIEQWRLKMEQQRLKLQRGPH